MSTALTVLGIMLAVSVGVGSLFAGIVAWICWADINSMAIYPNQKPSGRQLWLSGHRVALTVQFFIVVPLLVFIVASTGLGLGTNADHCRNGAHYVEVSSTGDWWCEA